MIRTTNKRITVVGISVIVALMCVFAAGTVFAVSPHPDARAKIGASKISEAEYQSDLQRMRELGINQPDDVLQRIADKRAAIGMAQAATPFKVLVLLVDFSDNVQQVNASFFDDLLFDSTGNSVRHYYDEVSGSSIDIVTSTMPSTTGWYRAPQTYAYYVDGQRGLFGTYPNNTQKLVEDLVDLADPDVDFSDYDNDNNGYVDALIVVHSGPGYETTLDVNDIHSHKWGINRRMKDGVYIQSYTIQPEFMGTPGDQTIGVYCHELGHIFGLPDLYDTDYSSSGVGKWCLMAAGSWNGGSGSSPSHPSAWCRDQLGWANKVNVTSNSMNRMIGAVEDGGSIYRLWSSGDSNSSEYFLVENRQRSGYDSALPADGLLIWHVDEDKLGVTDNDSEWYPGQSGSNHYLVALEQADGDFDLEHDRNNGDSGDPFPGSTNNTGFSLSTDPNSDSYLAGNTVVAVNNISASSLVMTADLIVGIAADVESTEDELLPFSAELAQNYPNPFNPATTIEFSLSASNRVRLEVFNITGQKVKSLLDDVVQPGSHEVVWDATDDSGDDVASGIYLYKLDTEGQTSVKKMVLAR